MPSARLDIMIQDPLVGRYPGQRLTEHVDITDEDVLLDGPTSRRVAVLDFDPQTGELLPGAVYQPPVAGRRRGTYLGADLENGHGGWPPTVLQVHAFATVWKTMRLYEQRNVLGRTLTWAFGAPQLFVVPRAGQLENAFYERESHSLQFFFFPTADQQVVVYTSLSRDIVAHETGHAILDGIAPDLYDTSSPQSLALHEGIADLTALFMAFESPTLVDFVLRQNNGAIDRSSDFSAIAPQFGQALDPHAGALRDLFNRNTLGLVASVEPHELSQVLTGAAYSVLCNIHSSMQQRFIDRDHLAPIPAAGKALGVGSERLRRILFRGLDYLPPGEISFADYARAVIAADQAAYPDRGAERALLIDEFVSRGIVPNPAALDVETNFCHRAVDSLDLPQLVSTDSYAYSFANANRSLLSIPADVQYFHVRPRRVMTKMYFHRDSGEVPVQECLFQVWWDRTESNPLGARFPSDRQISVGTTLAIDWDTRQVRACLTTDPEAHKPDRDRYLSNLAVAGTLVPDRQARGPDGKPRPSVVRAETGGGVMRVIGSGRALHIATGEA